MLTDTPTTESDPTLAVAERQLELLGELAEIVMVAARAFGASAVAAAEAENAVLEEECFTPEVGRARACGAKDAADSLQKVARAARLTMKLQMAVAEMVRDIRAGVMTNSRVAVGDDAGGTPAVRGGDRGISVDRRRQAGSCRDDVDTDWTREETNSEHFVEFDGPDRLPNVPFRQTVDAIRADVGAKIDWTRWKIEAPTSDNEAFEAVGSPFHSPPPPLRGPPPPRRGAGEDCGPSPRPS